MQHVKTAASSASSPSLTGRRKPQVIIWRVLIYVWKVGTENEQLYSRETNKSQPYINTFKGKKHSLMHYFYILFYMKACDKSIWNLNLRLTKILLKALSLLNQKPLFYLKACCPCYIRNLWFVWRHVAPVAGGDKVWGLVLTSDLTSDSGQLIDHHKILSTHRASWENDWS